MHRYRTRLGMKDLQRYIRVFTRQFSESDEEVHRTQETIRLHRIQINGLEACGYRQQRKLATRRSSEMKALKEEIREIYDQMEIVYGENTYYTNLRSEASRSLILLAKRKPKDYRWSPY